MTLFKKITAFALASTMLLSATAFAYTDSSSIGFANKYAVNRLSNYNIINGNEFGAFQPTKSVTRAEMAKMISVMLNKGEPSNGTTSFYDTQGHWAEKYIADCVSRGIIAGRSTVQFSPNDNVTGQEAAKMLAIALGVNASTGGLTGSSWASNADKYATIFDLYYDITANTSGAITKQVAAQMISNALSTNTATYSGGDYTQSSTSMQTKVGFSNTSTNSARFIYDQIDNAGLTSRAMGGFTNNVTSHITISNSNISDVHFSVNMMSSGIDEVFIAKVNSGSMTAVENALNDRIEYLKTSKAFYPSDVDAANMAKIYKQGDYIMLYVSGTSGNYQKAEALFKQYAK